MWLFESSVCVIRPVLYLPQGAAMKSTMKLLVLALTVALLFTTGESVTDSPVSKHSCCCATGKPVFSFSFHWAGGFAELSGAQMHFTVGIKSEAWNWLSCGDQKTELMSKSSLMKNHINTSHVWSDMLQNRKCEICPCCFCFQVKLWTAIAVSQKGLEETVNSA